ncbi:TolC family protein [Flavobacterium psychrotolerans]|uniref:TolC family protein n=1 Tax=Flavobacterium psychrotolerans TaxID=2169410 RepID=A0A2U1JHD3_9FLAO|nr:TolC family protein [Flavobacterium psychrotolerans]PWA04338.1 TolC family protein [Flavobacterium psychrotolerans]
MQINKLLLLFLFTGVSAIYSQETDKKNLKDATKLNLKEAVDLAINNSNEALLANTKVETKKLEVQSMKNNRYPDLKVSGQYMRLTNASVDLKINTNPNSGNSGAAPKVNQLILGQANVSLPLFSGFKLQNSIKASEYLYQAEMAKSVQTKEEIAMKVVEYYANLYRAQKAVGLIKENLKSAEQRAKDFEALEQNGIIARNDLLKAQLQQSKVQLSLDEAYKNVSIINYYLVTLLKLSDDYKIYIDEHQFDNNQPINVLKSEEVGLKNRKDLEAIHFIQSANESNVKIAKSAYFPSIALVGGYTTLNLQNVVTVQNAMNVGLGVSYNLSSIFKNGKEVKIAKNKALETQQSEAILSENIKIQVQQSIENYNLALKQNLVYEQAIGQATENYRIVKDKYDNGLSNTTDLLDADVEQLNSKINYAYSRANIMLKYYEMLSASGGLTSSFNLSKN